MKKRIEDTLNLFIGEMAVLFAGIFIGLKWVGQFNLGWGITIGIAVVCIYIDEYIQTSVWNDKPERKEKESK